ncbi:MAG: hypothetical protein OEM78_14690 [Gammaproteobacteria bacterium]|nr:hypothetical protein [Gammaproteobacteria bacterium]
MQARFLTILGCLALSACASVPSLFGSRPSEPASGPDLGAAAASPMDTRSLGIYLETMQALVEGDAVLQAEVFDSAAEAAALAPTTTNRLRFALALATPGHAGADPLQAQRRLAELLAAGDTLLPEERILATIHLQEVEERLILDTAARQQSQTSAAEIARLDADRTERLAAAQAENQRLRDELADAQEKLEAITSIERSIRERDGATNVQ